MSHRLSFSLVMFCIASAGQCVASAHAAPDIACDPNAPQIRAVGDTASDAACTDATIQAAIDNSVCANAKIFITPAHGYTAQHLLVQDKSLSLIGTSASCAGVGGTPPVAAQTLPIAPLVTLDGSGNGGTSVLAVRGTGNVTLQFLELTHGSGGTGSHGGGIDFQGAGTLTLDTTTIDGNSANFGGGVGFSGAGGSAALVLDAYAVIESNIASGNGGGIDIEGTADLSAVQPFTRIHGNQAVNGNGGGVAVVSPAHADIGSPGYDGVGVLDGNAAALGGGISGQVTNEDELVMNFFSTDARHPVTLSNNFASQGGGALYVLPHGNGLAVACLAEFRIVGNTSPEGAAILIDADVATTGTPAAAYLEFNAANFLFCPNALVHTACAPDVPCNLFEGNVSADGANQPQPGATITQRADFIGAFGGNRFAMRGNTGAHALQAIDATARLSNCLIADNAYSGAALSSENHGNGVQPPTFAIDSCTIVNNAPNGGSVVQTDYDLTLTDSIIDQPATPALATGNAARITVHDVLAANPAGLPPQTDIVTGAPTFSDATRGDYRLRAVVQNNVVTASLGIDFAPPGNGDTDLGGNPHDQDIPQVADGFGDRDLGCYEAQLIVDRVFADAFSDPITIVR